MPRLESRLVVFVLSLAVAVTFFSIGFIVLALTLGTFAVHVFARFTIFHTLGATAAAFCKAEGWAKRQHG